MSSQVSPGRAPPHNLEAERSVLGGVLIKPSAFDEVATSLAVDDFFLPVHREIFEAMLAIDRRQQALDVIAVADELRVRGMIARLEGGEGYLVALGNSVPTAENIAHYARLVKEKATLRRLIAACAEIQSRAYGDFGEFEQFLDEAETQIFKVAQQNRRETYAAVTEIIEEVLHNIEVRAAERKAVTGVPTGFTKLDEITAGLQRENLIVVAARPGGGKTSWAVNVAVHAAMRKIPVLIFSLEMSKYELMERMLAAEARIDSSRIKRGFLEYSDWKNKIHPASKSLAEAPILIDDSSAISIMEIRAKARRFRGDARYFPPPGPPVDGRAPAPPLGLVVVDYLQLARGSAGRREENRQQEIAEISRGLKALAKDLKLPIIAVSQLNREVEKREGRPKLSDLRECVVGETMVALADGRRVPIRDLVGTEPEVLAMSDEGRIDRARADKVWSVGRRRVFRLTLASGRSIVATARHRLFAADGWRRIADLHAGDRLAIARTVPEPTSVESWPNARVALLGQLIGDGSYLEGSPLRYTTSSEENSAIVAEAARAEFGCSVKRYAGRRSWHQLLISGNGNRWHPAGVNLWLRELCIFGQRSHEKRIPENAFRLGNPQIALLLRHLWATDGTITPRIEGRGGHAVYYSTNSEKLAADVAALLLRLGIVARTYVVAQGRYRAAHMVSVSGGESQRLFLERVGAFGPRVLPARRLAAALDGKARCTNVDTVPVQVFDVVRTLMRRAGISHRRMAALRGTAYGGTSHFRFAPSRTVLAEYARILESPELATQAANDLFWDRIASIEPAGDAEVFDLTVPGPASWLAESIVSHNSGAIEQDADMILFIHREDQGGSGGDFGDSGPTAVAEIIVGKHRNGATGSVKVTFIKEYTKFENYADDPEF